MSMWTTEQYSPGVTVVLIRMPKSTAIERGARLNAQDERRKQTNKNRKVLLYANGVFVENV